MKFKLLSLLALLSFTADCLNENPLAKTFTSKKDVFGARVFAENKGQFNFSVKSTSPVKYAYENGDEKIYFTEKGLIYKLVKHYPVTEKQEEAIERGKPVKLTPDDIYFVEMNWAGSNSAIKIEESEKQAHYFSYGNIEYKSNVYKKLTYKNVYNGIDIEYTMPDDKD